MNPKPANYVIKRLKVFIKRIAKPYEKEPMFVIEKLNNKKIELRTDGIVYDFLYDPMGGDVPSLNNRMFSKFYDLVNGMGWEIENEGGGVIHIYHF